MKLTTICFAIFLVLLTSTACKNSQLVPQSINFNINSSKLATIPDGYEMGEALFSADGHDVAFVVRKKDKAFVYHNGRMSKPYDDARSLIFRADDSKDLAFIARKADKEFVVVRGDEGTRSDTIRQLFFSQNGKIIYTATQGDASIVTAGEHKTDLIRSPLTLVVETAQGKKLSFINYNDAEKKGQLRICSSDLKDCVDGKKYDYLAALKTDKSRSHLACIVGQDGKMTVITVDSTQSGLSEKEGAWYDEVFNFDISDGGKHLSFLARRSNKSFLVKDSVEIAYPAFDMPLDVVVGLNGRTLFTGVQRNNVLAFIDKELIGKDYSEIAFPSFNAEGTSYAFAAVLGSGNSVVVNGRKGPLFEKVVTPRFTPHGLGVAYRARRSGERFVVVADKDAMTVREHLHYEAVWEVAFSPDGKYVGYGVKKGNELWWHTEKLDK